jgi:hypothetical protein
VNQACQAADRRSGIGKSAFAALLFLATWLAVLVGDGAAPIPPQLTAPSAGAPTIVDSSLAPRFATERAADGRTSRPDTDPFDAGDGGAALPAAIAALPAPRRVAAPLPPLSSDPLAAQGASGFRARAPPRG